MGRKSEGPGAALDDVSKAIIEQLQQDGRRSYAAIGKVVGLSEAAVRQRVQRLVEGGVMQVVAVTDPLELGFARQAMIGIRVQGPLEPVADALAALSEVDYVVVTAGSYDLLAEAVCE
ncbi:MAG: Lrp/AsnC family transcriptional regulator, partial [Nocardioides sp.]